MMLTIQSVKDVSLVYTPGWCLSPHPMPHERTPESNKKYNLIIDVLTVSPHLRVHI